MAGMLVAAYYYIWYGDGGPGYGRSHWSDNAERAVPMKPVLGYYDSESIATIDAHIDMMMQGGIDFAFLSWWSDTPTMTRICGSFLDRASLKGFHAAVMVEGHEEEQTELWKADCDYVYENWATHDAYQQYLDKPLILLAPNWSENMYAGEYADERFTLRWLSNRMGYAGEWGYWDLTPQQYAFGEQSTVIPGFDNRGLTRSGCKVGNLVPRSVQFLEEQWRIVRGYSPSVVTVCSFNEWHEGTCLEPCNEWGYEYLNANRKGSGYYGEVI